MVPEDLRDVRIDPAKVPEPLRRVIGRREVVKSYKTGSHTQAKTLHHREMAAVDRLIAEARAWLSGQGVKVRTEPPPPLVVPTLADARAVILHWFHQEEGRRLARPMPDADDPADREADREAVLDGLKAEDAALTGEHGRQGAEQVLPGVLAAAGYAMPSGDVRRVAVEIMQRAMAEGVARELIRYGETAAADAALSSITITSAPPPAPAAGITFGALIDHYLAAPERAGLSPKTKLKYAGFRRVLVGIIGETKTASAVDRAACRDVQAVLLTLPPNATKRWPKLTARQAAEKAKAEGVEGMHPNSARNHLDFLASVFKFGSEEGLVERNPASGLNANTARGVTAPAKGEKRRRFTTGELRAIFSAPLYTGCQDDQNGYDKPGPNHPRRGRFWVPLLGLWTGLRLNEICQLGVADVEMVAGVPLIHVRAEADGARLKTAAAERSIPIHPELVRIGFLQHVEKMREAGERRLFPDLPMGKAGTYADPFSKWFGRFLTKARVTAAGTVFHSFRHGWRTQLRDADVPTDTANILGGWATPGEGANYGDAGSVIRLAGHIGKICYPGLDLTHLYAAWEGQAPTEPVELGRPRPA